MLAHHISSKPPLNFLHCFLFSLSFFLFLSFSSLSRLRNNAYYPSHIFSFLFVYQNPKSKHSCMSKANSSRPSHNKITPPLVSPTLHVQVSLSLSLAWMRWMAFELLFLSQSHFVSSLISILFLW